jgi:hypothetical protein
MISASMGNVYKVRFTAFFKPLAHVLPPVPSARIAVFTVRAVDSKDGQKGDRSIVSSSQLASLALAI